MKFDPQLPSPFYRATSRALIMDEENRLIVVKDEHGYWQIPGGGWEHQESFRECVEHELQEELGVGALNVSAPLFMYRVLDDKGYYSLRIAVKVTPTSYNFVPGDDMVEYRALTKAEFLDFTFSPGEGPIQDHADQIWP